MIRYYINNIVDAFSPSYNYPCEININSHTLGNRRDYPTFHNNSSINAQVKPRTIPAAACKCTRLVEVPSLPSPPAFSCFNKYMRFSDVNPNAVTYIAAAALNSRGKDWLHLPHQTGR
ncbi:hypothetical protein ECG_05704 [Echinococcus granulosus]|nr:hypothetical protein ECG_05704 [Echinococcus granulosus]